MLRNMYFGSHVIALSAEAWLTSRIRTSPSQGPVEPRFRLLPVRIGVVIFSSRSCVETDWLGMGFATGSSGRRLADIVFSGPRSSLKN